jgi:hypothetical protein
VLEPLEVEAEVLALAVPTATQGWAITANSLFTYDGSAWQRITPPVPAGSVYVDLRATGPENVWALLNPPGLLRWTGAAWEFHDLTPIGGSARLTRLRPVLDPERSGRTDVWVVGSPPVVARYRVLAAVGVLALPWLSR